MAQQPTQTVTVDRISNNGNPIADQTRDGKDIHVPAGDPGDVLEVRLIDAGSHYRAKVVNTATEATPTGPRRNPSTPAQASPELQRIAEKTCGDRMISISQRHDSSDLGPNEYPGKNKRRTIARRHD